MTIAHQLIGRFEDVLGGVGNRRRRAADAAAGDQLDSVTAHSACCPDPLVELLAPRSVRRVRESLHERPRRLRLVVASVVYR